MHADYFLPAAGYYEKHGIKYAQSYIALRRPLGRGGEAAR